MAKTSEQVKAEWRKHGITMVHWAHENGFSVSAVSAVLRGQHKGNYGKSHQIMVALGMKDLPPCSS